MIEDDSIRERDPFLGEDPMDPTLASVPGIAPIPGFAYAVRRLQRSMRRLQRSARELSVIDLRRCYGACRGDLIAKPIVIYRERVPPRYQAIGGGRKPKPPAKGADDRAWAIFWEKQRRYEDRVQEIPIDPDFARSMQGKRVRGQIFGEDRFVGKPYYSRAWHLGAMARGLSEAITCRRAVARQDWPAAIDAAALTALWAGWVEQYAAAYRAKRAAFDAMAAAQAKASDRARTPTADNRKKYGDSDAWIRRQLALPENAKGKVFATTRAKRWAGQTEYSERVLVLKIREFSREEKK